MQRAQTNLPSSDRDEALSTLAVTAHLFNGVLHCTHAGPEGKHVNRKPSTSSTYMPSM